MIERNISSSEPPSILSLKNILSRVKDQISMRTITVAIRQYCMEHQQIQQKDRFLSFFLHSESKLKRHSNAEWNRVINNQIRKVVGLQKVDHALAKIVCRDSFRKLREITSENQDQQMDSVLSDALGDLKDLEISEDIKMKTKYFFQWCTFIAERRQFKRMKNKEVDDLKKSKVFNQYSVKFKCFIQWKQHVRKTKVQNQKARTIETNSKNRLLKRVLAHINEKTEVIIIQNLLQDAVEERMTQVKLKRVFSRLRKNKAVEQNHRFQPRENENLWVYRFYTFITSKIQRYMNKSSLESRRLMEEKYQLLSLKNCWRQLKSQVQHTNSRLKRVKDLLKTVNIKKLIQIKRTLASTKGKCKQIRMERKMVQYKHFFDLIEEGSKFELSFIGKIRMMEDYIKTHTLFHLMNNIKRVKQTKTQLKVKLAVINKSTKTAKRLRFVRNIAEQASKQKEMQSKNQQLICTYLINTFQRRVNNYKKHKQSSCQLRQQLQLRHERYLNQLAWKCLVRYKWVKASESQTLQTFSTILEMKIKQQSFSQLKARDQHINRIERLVNKSQYVVLKVAFVTILNRMLNSKMKIKNFYQQQDLSHKRKLFQLLKCNSEIMSENSGKVKKIAIKFAKRRLFLSFHSMMASKMQTERISQLQGRHDKITVLERLEQNKNFVQAEQENLNNVSLVLKGNGMRRIIGSCNYKLSYREEECHKMSKINKLIVRNYIKSMKKLNRSRKEQSVINAYNQKQNNEKVKQIRQRFRTNCLLKLLRQKQSTVSGKTAILMSKKYKSFLQFMKINYHSSICRKGLKLKQLHELIQLTQISYSLAGKVRTLANKRRQSKRVISTLQNNYYCEVDERQTKTNLLSDCITHNRQTSAKQLLIHRLHHHQQLKQNTLILVSRIIKQKLGYLVRSYLTTKSQSIKDIVALRLYASNIKKRTFRQLKQAMTATVLKQNRARTEHHSKLTMQKSMDHARRKSKLLQTIERYNMSRVSRVVR